MKLTPKKTIFFLLLWFTVAGAIYFLGVRAEAFWMPPVYLVCAVGALALFFLINGGFFPLLKSDGTEPRTQETPASFRRPNPLHLAPEKQALYARIALIVFLPLLVVFLVDYLLIFLQDIRL